MPLQLGVVMDPIAAIKPWKDTTLALLLAAQKRGWGLNYLELGDLFLRDGTAYGHLQSLTVTDSRNDWYALGEGACRPLAELDVILIDGEDLLGILDEIEAYEVFAEHFEGIRLGTPDDGGESDDTGLFDRIRSWLE